MVLVLIIHLNIKILQLLKITHLLKEQQKVWILIFLQKNFRKSMVVSVSVQNIEKNLIIIFSTYHQHPIIQKRIE